MFLSLALLAATALPFVISPGVSFTITLNASAQGDTGAPLKVWAGTAAGIALIAAVAGLSGLGRLVAGSELARTLFGVIGGSVLIVLGLALVIARIRARREESPPPPKNRLIAWSFVAVVTNVKALSLYALVVPGLTRSGLEGPALFFSFAGIHSAMLLAWLLLIGVAVRLAPALSTSARARTFLAAATSVTLIVLGLRSIVDALA